MNIPFIEVLLNHIAGIAMQYSLLCYQAAYIAGLLQIYKVIVN